MYVCMYVCMYVYVESVVHYTCYVNKYGQISLIQIHPEPRPTPESLEVLTSETDITGSKVLTQVLSYVNPQKRFL